MSLKNKIILLVLVDLSLFLILIYLLYLEMWIEALLPFLLSLGISFWAVYTIGGTIVALPAIVLPETSSAILIFVPFQFIYLIWAMVGTWRSASKFKPKKKQWSWGTIAKVYIALNLIRGIVKFFQ